MSTQRFQPENLPIFHHEEVRRLAEYMGRQHRNIAANFEAIDRLSLFKRNAAPERVEDGMVVFADGTNWDPGSGEGFYGYYAGSWHFLG